MAMTGPRVPTRKGPDGVDSTVPVKGSTTIYNGALVVMESGLAVPGKVGASLTVVGIAKSTVVNSGGDGAAKVTTERGTFKFANYASDLVAAGDIGKTCYVYDDQTVAKTHDTNARSAAGKVIDVDADGVWVRID